MRLLLMLAFTASVTAQNMTVQVPNINVATNATVGNGLSVAGALTNSALTASRALATGADKSLASSATTATELGFVSGVTSAIQAQLDGKQASIGYTPVNKAGDSMTGPLLVTGLTNSARTASRFVVAAADKSDTSTATSAVLIDTLSDETGTGVSVFNVSPTLSTAINLDGTTSSFSSIRPFTDVFSAPSVKIVRADGSGSAGFFGGYLASFGTSTSDSTGVYIVLNGNATGIRLGSGSTFAWSSSASGSAATINSADTLIGRGGAAGTVEQGADAASPVNQTYKAADGSGTDKNGANLTVEGGQSTGTGAGGDFDIATSLTADSTGSTANSYSLRYHANAKFVALTHNTATTIETFSLAANKILGGELVVTTYATNSTPHLQARTTSLVFQAVAVSTTITGAIDVAKAGTLAASSGTMTETYTLLDNGNNTFSIQLAANSDLSSPTERCRVIVTALNGNAAVTITDP